MPTLQFKGKQLVQNHHLVVPFHELKPVAGKSVLAKRAKASLHDNVIMHGDNLAALKALLPTHQGKIKCIYIDPPYNTGNEGWVYNDNVNDPMLKEWLGKAVDKEDLTRHDKWLCMMWPRLRLLRELLTEDGVIFISIDDNESSNLNLILDEIFGEQNFLAQLTVLSNPKGRGMGEHFARSHDYVFAYQKRELKDELSVKKSDEEVLAQYPEVNKDGRRYRLLELRNTHREFGKHNRPNLYYPFYVAPDGKVSLDKVKGYEKVLPDWDDGYAGCWGWGETKARSEITDLAAREIGGKWKIFRKAYAQAESGEVVSKKMKTVLTDAVFHTEKGQKELEEILSGRVFPSPKPPSLIKALIALINDNNAIILDSFAGSGTTAHAVLALNKEDGGNRKFILIETLDYADTITAERVRRVIRGVPNARDEALKEGLGGTFSYFELGKPVELQSILNGKSLPDYNELARYVFFMATGEEWNPKEMDSKKNYIGESRNYHVYLFYQPDVAYLKNTALTLDHAEKLPKWKPGEKRRLIFAPTKYLDQDYLDRFGIDFARLPYEIYQLAGGKKKSGDERWN